jgi:glycosyltransferase involved in cell wall biosynthesis
MKLAESSLLLVWGIYDSGKARVRILLDGLRQNEVPLYECNTHIWQGVEDKSQLRGFITKLLFAGRWLLSYPGLIWRYLRAPAHEAVLVPYMGHLDVLVLWPFAKLRGAYIVWDAFLSLYNTVVEDRRMMGSRHPLSRMLWGLEWLACRAADRIVLDTTTHGRYFIETFGVRPEKVRRVLVGAETNKFRTDKVLFPKREKTRPFTVLYYGQFIPLHGTETVVRAAHLCDDETIHWIIVGKGQEQKRMRALVDELNPRNFEWIDWVPYEQLVHRIASADICLGIFGTTEKAYRVIPNKVYQIVAAGRPLITMDSPAVRELLSEQPGVTLIAPGDPTLLTQTVCRWARQPLPVPEGGWHRDLMGKISPKAIGHALFQIVQELKAEHR